MTRVEPVSVNEWMKVFKDLYSKADSERTPEQMWIAVMAHTSEIGESIRKFAFESLLKSAAHTFCWLCSFVNKCNVMQNDDIFCISESLPGIVSLKYPDVCGYCREKPCKCDPVKMESETDKSAMYTDLLDRRSRVLRAQEDFSVESYKRMFKEIYGGRVHIQTLESIGFHFLEEIGEAAVCVRKLSQLRRISQDESTGIDSTFVKQLSKVDSIVKNYIEYRTTEEIDYAVKDPRMLKARVVDAKMGLVVEIADSFSWFCALLNKLDSISRFIWDHPDKHKPLKQVEHVLRNEYFSRTGNARCPSCKKKPCRCVFYNLGSVKRKRQVVSQK
jgi:NTP pyrophosphatase (non-canonical NTP hydrolase)